MKVKRYPEGYKSREDFEQTWLEKMNPLYEDKCSYCFKELGEPFDAIPMKIKYMPDEIAQVIEDFRGLYIPMLLLQDEKIVSALCAGEDSPAKKDGFDLIFPVCEDCKSELRELLDKYFSGDPSKLVVWLRIEMLVEEWFEEVSEKGVLEVAKMLMFLKSFKDDKGETH